MKIRKKDKRLGAAIILFSLSIILMIIYISLFFEGRIPTRKEDVDGDGVDEIIKEVHFPDSYLVDVIYENGTIYKTKYSTDGVLLHEWKLIPDPDKEDEFIIYTWDNETEQWLLDQNRDGIPDEKQNQANDIFHFSQ